MSNSELAYVTPEVVSWAINRRGLSRAKLGQSLSVSQGDVQAWERGDAYPPFSKAIQLAKLLRVPFGYFFLSVPPAVEVPLPDFRTRRSVESSEPSVDFLELLYSVLAKQDWYREYAEAHASEKLPFVGSFSLKDSPLRVAISIRNTMGIDKGLRKTASSLGDYISRLSLRAEAAGILVMRSGVVGNDATRPLSADEFQGFAVTDTIASVIFINARDFKVAQIFTLAHELAHIWIGKSGISKPNETDVADKSGGDQKSKIELFCNAVAAEVLVPKAEFLAAWRGTSPETSARELSREFRVSTRVILRRAYELDVISRNKFFALLKNEPSNQKAPPTGGGNFYQSLRSRHSPRFIETLLGDVRQGGTVFRDAARLMNLKVPTMVSFMENVK